MKKTEHKNKPNQIDQTETELNVTNQVSLIPIMMVNFIGTLGFSLVIPFLVIVIHDMGGNAFIYGLVAAAYPFFQLIGAPLLGKWSDAIGRRPVLLLSQLGTLLSWVVFLGALWLPISPILSHTSALTGSFFISVPLLLVALARAFDGLTGGNISVAKAYLGDISDHQNRSANFGKFQMAATLGFTVGPALAGMLGETPLGSKLPVMAAILISTVASVVIAFWLPESRKLQTAGKTPEKTKPRKAFSLASYAEVFRLPKVGPLVLLYFMLFLAFNLFYVVFPVFATQGLGWSVGRMGLYFAILSVMMAAVQGPILGWASSRFTESKLFVVGTFFLSLTFVLFATTTDHFLYLAAACFAVGNGLGWPSLLSLLSKRAGAEKQGLVHGTAESGGSLAAIIGLIGGGLLYPTLGPNTFFVSAVMMFLVALGALRFVDSHD